MSEEKNGQDHATIEAFDKFVEATSSYLRSIFPTIFKLLGSDKKKDQ